MLERLTRLAHAEHMRNLATTCQSGDARVMCDPAHTWLWLMVTCFLVVKTSIDADTVVARMQFMPTLPSVTALPLVRHAHSHGQNRIDAHRLMAGKI